jgi:hypothetical protein
MPVEESIEESAEELEETVGRIHGVVSNGSGGEVPSGLTVTLRGYDHGDVEFEEVVNISATVQVDSTFDFTDVDMVPGRLFLVSVDHEGIAYSSPVSQEEVDTGSAEVDVTIYDSISEPSGLVVSRMHVFFEFPTPDVVQVVNLLVISNQGAHTVVPEGPGKPAVIISLPEDATNVAFQEETSGERFILTDDGFGDIRAIYPFSSNNQILFSYDLPYKRKANISIPIDLSVDTLMAFLPASDIKLSSSLLEETGVQDVGGISYQMYVSGGMEAGSDIEITLKGSAPGDETNWFNLDSSGAIYIGVIAFVASLGVAGIWLYRRRKEDEFEFYPSDLEGEVSTILDDNDIKETPESIMDAIIRLDDLLDSGEYSPEEHQRQREELKNRLRGLLKDKAHQEKP